jgi:perosamine synthetase
VATFSFYGNKTVTTGEGGMVVFKNPAVAERAAMLRDHGMMKTKRYWHAEVGYNYRMTNIQAAIGVAQVERLDEFVSAKRHIAKTYNEALADFKAFQVAAIDPDCINSYWLYTCMVKPGAGFTRDQLIEYLNTHGIETRPVFYPMHIMPPYVHYGPPERLTVSKQLSEQGISFPTSVNLTEMELAHICKMVTTFARKF